MANNRNKSVDGHCSYLLDHTSTLQGKANLPNSFISWGAAEKIVVVASREYCRFSAGGAVLGLRLGREWLKDVAVPIRSRKETRAGNEPPGLEADSRVFEMWVTDKAVRKSVTEAALRRTNAVCYEVL
jgi:hypothetical protein